MTSKLIYFLKYFKSNSKNELLPNNMTQIWNTSNSNISYRRFFVIKQQPYLTRLNLCYLSVLIAFILGLSIGIFIPIFYYTKQQINHHSIYNNNNTTYLNDYNSQQLKNIFINNSFSKLKNSNNNSSVKFIETLTTISSLLVPSVANNQIDDNNGIVLNNIYWGELIESALPIGFNNDSIVKWNNYINNNKHITVINIEHGCGRMQNRLITFNDGQQACVRYRQNTDQIQGELFSFYLAQILNLTNLVPSTVSVIDLNHQLWSNIKNQIQLVQWNSNRPVVLTKFIKNLDTAFIPNLFKSMDEQRHLNKFDVFKLIENNKKISNKLLNYFIELAQWCDLIIFDYLTANLDRVVNNLYNYQWNVNIMDAPAHNLAREIDTNLLIFLDNESGLLHGYRLLKKYEIYHTLLLDNLCLFRKSTVNIIRQLYKHKNIGELLKLKFYNENSDKIKEILPTLPDKSVKILNERIERVYRQIQICENKFSDNSL